MPIKIDFFDGIAKEIEGKLKRVYHLIPESNLKSGEYHEQIIRQSLENFLPNRYSVKTGYIYLDENKSSKQIDILLIDESHPNAYLFKDRDFVIVRPEPVIAAIEVKTQLVERELVGSFNNIGVAKKLKTEALGNLHGHMYGSVFGYFSNHKMPHSTLDKWFKNITFEEPDLSPASYWPDSIFFFDHGLFLYLDNNRQIDKKSEQAYYYRLYRRGKGSDRAWQLAFLIASLVTMCEKEENTRVFIRMPMQKAQRNDTFLDLSNAEVSYDRYCPKYGHSRMIIAATG